MEEEDFMESTASEIYSDNDVVVFRMQNKHFQAAKKYLVCLNLSKYSVEKGDEFEITLNKKTHRSIISQIKEFTSEEIPISNYERSLSAMNELSENYLNVHFIISPSILLLYGLRKEVSAVKIDFLAQLGNSDEINMGMIDCTAKSLGGKVASGQSSQEKESKIRQNKRYTLNDKPINSDGGKVRTFVESTSVKSASICHSEKETRKTSVTGLLDVLKHRSQKFYEGHKTNLKVSVRKENITKLDVDILVNGANRRLKHGGGVSHAIALAAGHSLVNECNSHITTNGPLDITDVFVSSGGLLKAKYVIHAVGPKWETYKYKDQCLTDLRRTVVRCLVEASRLQNVSIAFPSISAGIFKVPKELCAHCYMEAVKCFDAFADKLDFVPVKDIWFVDIDDVMVNIIEETFTNEWGKPVNLKIAREVFTFTQQHLCKNIDFKNKSKQHSPQGTKLLDESHTMVSQGAGANTTVYQVNSIQIHIVTKPATVYRSTIVVVGQLFDELSGLKNFNAKDSAEARCDLPKKKGAFKYLSLSKPDGSQSTLICQLHPNPDSLDNVKKAFENLGKVEEIHSSDTVVFTSAIFYAKLQKDTTKIISSIAGKVVDFATVTSSTKSVIKHIFIATGADCIPQVIKMFNSRKIDNITPQQTFKETGIFHHFGHGLAADEQQIIVGCPAPSYAYPATAGVYPATSGGFSATLEGCRATGYPRTLGKYPTKKGEQAANMGGYPATSKDYPETLGGSYPAKSGGYPATSSTYPATSGGYPAASVALPATLGGYPAKSRDYPTTSEKYQATSGGYPATSGGYPATSGGYPGTLGSYTATSRGFPATSCNYPEIPGGYPAKSDGYIEKAVGSPDTVRGNQAVSGLGSPVDLNDCSVCFDGRDTEVLKCCQALICSTCLGKISKCPVCKFHLKVLIGQQPNGDMRCSYSSLDVDGYERKGSFVIEYHIPAGYQTKNLQHPSPGKPYKSIKRTAYLPATDDGYRALRLLRVAFHRRLIFTIDVSHTTQMEGIVWNIHHKTSRHASEHGFPDPNYLLSLMFELRQNGVTEDSLTVEEKRLSEEFILSLIRNVQQ